MAGSISTSLHPLPERDFTRAHARHLLSRAAMGASAPALARCTQLGLRRAVTDLLDGRLDPGTEYAAATPVGPELDPDVVSTMSLRELKSLRRARRGGDTEAAAALVRKRREMRRLDGQLMVELRRWWIERLMAGPDPLRETMTLLWHGHFATRWSSVRDAYLMQQQNTLFRDHALASFAGLARGIVHDPAMLKFLNNDRNVRARPNENLARELMELFTLGEGNYAEDDVKQAARALTGYHVDDNDFRLRPFLHDDGEKTILGRRERFDGDALADWLLEQRAASRFIAYKLYRHFVADVGDWHAQPDRADVPDHARAVILQLADLLLERDYQIRPVLEVLLASRHFFDPGIVGRKIKSPVELVVSTTRGFDLPARADARLQRSLRIMGQELFDPPSVAGWETGRAWINTSTLFTRQNTAAYLIAGQAEGSRVNPRRLRLDPDRAFAWARPAERPVCDVVDDLVDLHVGPHVPDVRRQPLRDLAQQGDGRWTREKAFAIATLMTAMPEYQLC